jgi:hypothetical protein
MASKADEYRAKAKECEVMAANLTDPILKQQLIDTARKWRELAVQIERSERD